MLHQKGRYSVKYILPVYHGGRARGQRCRKDSREAAGSDKAGWINILNIHVRTVKEREASQLGSPKFTTIDNMVLGMSFSDTSSSWSPSCHRVPSTPPNPRAGPTPPPFQGWQNSPVLKTKDCHEYHLRSHLRQPELVCCPKVDMLPTRLVQVWSDHQPEILNSTKNTIRC